MTARRPLYAGVDGCRSGWFAALRNESGGPVELMLFATFGELVAALDRRATIAVDMPIGLPERIVGTGRAAEIAARRHLGARQSSVFSIPARAVVESFPPFFFDEMHRRESHAAASALARTLSDPPKGVSIQGYMLFGKILEIDRILRADPPLVGRVIESHPEVAFTVLNAMLPMALPKKVKNRANPAGLAERAGLLRERGLPVAPLECPLPRGVGEDDRLDALVLLLVAERVAAGLAQSFPDPPGRDVYGLPIAIRA